MFQTFRLWGEDVRAKAEFQLASGNVGRVLRRAAVAGDTDLEAEADRAVMGDCVGVGRGWTGFWGESRGGLWEHSVLRKQQFLW